MNIKMTLCLIMIIILSCDNEERYDPYLIWRSIDTDITFMPVEVYRDRFTPEAPTLKLELVTTQEYGCVNFKLVTTEFMQEGELIIRFDEVVEPFGCLTAVGPAISYVDLPEDIDLLTFINGDVVDRYTIEINEESVRINAIDNDFTISSYDNTFRYPPNTFAFICGTNVDNTQLYADFLNVLNANPSLSLYEFMGEGRIPYPVASSIHWVNHLSVFFEYEQESDFDNLEFVLDDFVSQNSYRFSGAGITLRSWNNKRH